MVGPFLRGKRRWYDDDTRRAIACLEEIMGALEVSDEILAARAGMPYEGLVMSLLADDLELTLPFATAIGRLWAAFPGRYAVDALALRDSLEPRDVDWLYAAAGDGLLSTDPGDYDLVAKVVLPEDLPPAVDRARLEARIAGADADGAWSTFVATHRDLVANLFLDAVFFRARVMHAAMVLDRLDRIAELQPGLLDLVAEALAGWDAGDVVREGMRSDGPPDCRESLVEALRSRDFDALPAECLP